MLRHSLLRLVIVLGFVSVLSWLPVGPTETDWTVRAAPCEFCPPHPVRWDFNGDGYKDLVVDVPYERLDDEEVAPGAVHVLYGGQTGVTSTGNQFLTHLTSPKVGNGKAGSSFDSGDFNGDGFADLAVGAKVARASGGLRSGVVDVLYGSSSGLSGWKHQEWDNMSAPTWPAPAGSAAFGAALAAGDFNADGFDDLAIGATGGGGYVIVLDGSASGLTAAGSDVWTQDSPGIPGAIEGTDLFGDVLLAANFGKGSADDLAIGAPRDFVGTRLAGSPGANAGSVHILYGSEQGLAAAGTQRFTQGGVLGGVPEDEDWLGGALARGDFNADGSTDLAIGAPHEDMGVSDTGIVYVIHGTPDGLDSAAAPRVISAATLGLAPETRRLGASLTAGNFGTKGCVGCDDLAIGAPLENSTPEGDYNGAVYVMYGAADGNAATVERWEPGGSVPGKRFFGFAVAAHNFGKGGHADLVVGVSTDTNYVYGAGAAVILYGNSTGLTTSGVQFWSQASPGVPGSPETTYAGDHFAFGLGKSIR